MKKNVVFVVREKGGQPTGGRAPKTGKTTRDGTDW